MIRLCILRRNLQLSTPHRLRLDHASIPGRLQLVRYTHGHSLPAAPRIAELVTPEDTAEARSWVSKFKEETIPRGSVELTFSRSSGPGGQVSLHISDQPDRTLKRSLNPAACQQG